VSLAICFGPRAFADQWVDTKTGQRLPCFPIIGGEPGGRGPEATFRVVLPDPSDRDRAFDPKTGRNFVREACPPTTEGAQAPTGKEHALAPRDLFRPGEFQLDIFGVGGASHGTLTSTKTTIVVSPTMTHRVQQTKNTSPLDGAFGGAGGDVKYFVTENVGVCGEFQFTRQLASEISHRSAIAIDMSRGGWSEAKVHGSSEPA